MSKVESIETIWGGMVKDGTVQEVMTVLKDRLAPTVGGTALSPSVEAYDRMIERIATLPSDAYIDPFVEGVALPSTDQHGVAEGYFELRG